MTTLKISFLANSTESGKDTLSPSLRLWMMGPNEEKDLRKMKLLWHLFPINFWKSVTSDKLVIWNLFPINFEKSLHLIISDMYGSVIYDKYSCQIMKQIKASKEGEGDYVTYDVQIRLSDYVTYTSQLLLDSTKCMIKPSHRSIHWGPVSIVTLSETQCRHFASWSGQYFGLM